MWRCQAFPKGQVTVQRVDYHHLDPIPPESHDSIRTMEDGCARHRPASQRGWLAPIASSAQAGRIALLEYDHSFESNGAIGILTS